MQPNIQMNTVGNGSNLKAPLAAYLSLTWCLERKVPVGRRLFSQAGRRRSLSGEEEEQSPPPYSSQGPTMVPRPRTHHHHTHKPGNTLTMNNN